MNQRSAGNESQDSTGSSSGRKEGAQMNEIQMPDLNGDPIATSSRNAGLLEWACSFNVLLFWSVLNRISLESFNCVEGIPQAPFTGWVPDHILKAASPIRLIWSSMSEVSWIHSSGHPKLLKLPIPLAVDRWQPLSKWTPDVCLIFYTHLPPFPSAPSPILSFWKCVHPAVTTVIAVLLFITFFIYL